MLVALIANEFNLQYLPVSNAVITIGGFHLPPNWLQQFSPWNHFLIGTYGTVDLRYLIGLGLAVGLFQWALQAPKKFLTAWWIAWNFLGLVIGFVAIIILTLFEIDDIFLLSIFAGFIYGFLTVWSLVFRLDRLEMQRQQDVIDRV